MMMMMMMEHSCANKKRVFKTRRMEPVSSSRPLSQDKRQRYGHRDWLLEPKPFSNVASHQLMVFDSYDYDL